jgi:hypothetical protein
MTGASCTRIDDSALCAALLCDRAPVARAVLRAEGRSLSGRYCEQHAADREHAGWSLEPLTVRVES